MDKELLFACIDRFEQSSLDYLEVEDGDLRIELRKPASAGTGPVAGDSQVTGARAIGPVSDPEPAVPGASSGAGGDGARQRPDGNSFVREVRSPIVGVFYAAAEPGGEPFVREGERVAEGGTLCLIEAMKMMNEVKAPAGGIVRRIGCADGEMVECGQVLFELESF